MPAQPTEAEILAAIEATGFLMEQDVATELERIGYGVYTNHPFEDEDEHKSREIDVLAFQRKYQNETEKLEVWVEIICECKKNEHPFVFISRKKGRVDRHIDLPQYSFPHAGYEVHEPNGPRFIMPFDYFALQDHHYFGRQDDKTVQFTRIVRKGNGWEAHSGILDAVFYPIAKATMARIRSSRLSGGHTKRVILVFPTVVLNGALYQIDSSQRPFVPVKVKHVSFHRQLEAQTLRGQFLVDFVSQDFLTEFIQTKVEPFVKYVCQIAQFSSRLIQDKSRPAGVVLPIV